MTAQVTIGSDKAPLSGTLLMLDDGTTGGTGENAERGLGLPRVELKNLKPTSPTQLATSIGSVGNWDLAAHVGMVVYNVKEAVYNPTTCINEGGSPGLYVWDGTIWQALGVQANEGNEENVGTADPDEGIRDGKLYDRDGNDYNFATFGDAGTWMTENLRTLRVPGLLETITENVVASKTFMHFAYPQTTGAYVPSEPATWTKQQGLLYNWPAVKNKDLACAGQQGQVEGSTPGASEIEATQGTSQGICPFGWHVPSDREWNQLEKELTTKASLYSLSTANGTWDPVWETTGGDNRSLITTTVMKSTTKLEASETKGDSKTSENGGFDALFTGKADATGTYNFGTGGTFWSASSVDAHTVWVRGFRGNTQTVSRYPDDRSRLMAVRCKKD